MAMRESSVIRCVVGIVVSVVCGDVAQMVERSLSMREVQGSIPCFSSEIMLP